MTTKVPKEFSHEGIKWKTVKQLGKGSFGEAHLITTDTTFDAKGHAVAGTDRATAVCKVIHLEGLSADEKKESENEVKLLKRLNHPGIVQYYGSFQQGGMLFILMEYADAGDLEKLIDVQKGKHLDETTIGGLFTQIAYAVLYLHERRVLHRDLKAQNVFLKKGKKEGQLIVKLGDFGISTVLRNTLALAKTVCGTPYYFSPELCMNKPYNNKSDVWSLGCIMYELATLKHAFDAKNMKALTQRILKGTYEPISSKLYSSSASAVLAHMLQQRVPKRACIQEVVRSEFVQRQVAILASNLPEIGTTLAKKHLPHTASSSGASLPSGGGAAGARKLGAKGGGRDQLLSMAEIRQRAELTTYEEQQVHVNRAKKVVQDSQQRQQARMSQQDERDSQLEMLKRQMAEVDEKMRSRRSKAKGITPNRRDYDMRPRQHDHVPPSDYNQGPDYGGGAYNPEPEYQEDPLRNVDPRQLAKMYKDRVNTDAPWNQGRKVPIGFTAESWEAHQRLMNQAKPPVVARHSSGAPPSASDPDSYDPTPAHLRVKMTPDNKYGGARGLQSMIDADALLVPNPDATLKVGRDSNTALQLWEMEKQKIRDAEKNKLKLAAQLPPVGGGRGGGGSAPSHPPSLNSGNTELSQTEREWKEFQAQRNAARAQQQQPRVSQGQQPPSGAAGVYKHLPPSNAGQQHNLNPDDRPLYAPPVLSRAHRAPSPSTGLPIPVARPPIQPGVDGNQACAPVPLTKTKFAKKQQEEDNGGWQRGYEPSTPQRGGGPAQVSSSSYGSEDVDEESEEDDDDEDDPNYFEGDESYEEEEDPYGAMLQSMQAPSTLPEPPELFEEAALPGNEVSRLTNMVKFTLDGRTLNLKNVDQDDPLSLRIEALRLFLTENLGGEVSFTLLRDVLDEIQGPDMSDTEADVALANLQQRYGPKATYVDLMIQLMICENMIAEMDADQ